LHCLPFCMNRHELWLLSERKSQLTQIDAIARDQSERYCNNQEEDGGEVNCFHAGVKVAANTTRKVCVLVKISSGGFDHLFTSVC
jgi:hypothetical protein